MVQMLVRMKPRQTGALRKTLQTRVTLSLAHLPS
jgi:hypothetical protein